MICKGLEYFTSPEFSHSEVNNVRYLCTPRPRNEPLLLENLRASIGSHFSNPEFERYTNFGRRIFKTKVCFVSFFDTNPQWIRSSLGIDSTMRTNRYSFTKLSTLLDTPDVFVVLNSSIEDKSKCYSMDLSLHYGFYAGVNLIVGGNTVGTYIIADTNPRNEFTMTERIMLLDLGILVSNEIVLKRNQELRYREKLLKPYRLKHYIDVSLKSLHHNLRTPLATLSLAIQNLLNDYQKIKLKPSNNNNNIIKSDDILLTKAQSRTILEHVEIYSHHVEKVIAVCLETARLLPFLIDKTEYSNNQKNTNDDLLFLTQEHNTFDPNLEVLNIESTVKQISSLIQFMNHINMKKKNEDDKTQEISTILEDINNTSNIKLPIFIKDSNFNIHFEIGKNLKSMLLPSTTKNETNNNNNNNNIENNNNDNNVNKPIVIAKSFPHLLLTGTTSKLCQVIETICEWNDVSLNLSIEVYQTTSQEGCPLAIYTRDKSMSSSHGQSHAVIVVSITTKISKNVSLQNLRNKIENYTFTTLDKIAEMIGGGSTVSIQEVLNERYQNNNNNNNNDNNNTIEMEYLYWLPCCMEYLFDNLTSYSTASTSSTSTSSSSSSPPPPTTTLPTTTEEITTKYLNENKKIEKKLKVLLIDDSPLILQTLGDYLKEHNCEVITARNGITGLHYLKESILLPNLNQLNYDLIIVDCLMPSMCGVEMLMQFQYWLYLKQQHQEQYQQEDQNNNNQQLFDLNSILIEQLPTLQVLLPTTHFVGLLPPFSTFEEMIPDDVLQRLENQIFSSISLNNEQSLLSQQFGLETTFMKPIQLKDILELLERINQ